MKSTILTLGLLSASVGYSEISQPSEFNTAKGTALVAAPTALMGPTHQGVWFIKNKQFSLDLPQLTDKQVYEGWIVNNKNGGKISTGIFKNSGGIDSDAAGKFAGPLKLNFPPQPGSDFVASKIDLVDGNHSVVITVEPYPDFDPKPAAAILKADIPKDAKPGTEIEFDNIVNK